MSEELGDIVRELISLGKRKPLRNSDLARAKELMARLKEMGFTNKEISVLTGGMWAESTVKAYTRGVSVKDPSPKERAIKLLTQLVDMGLTLEDVKSAISMKEKLEAEGVDFADISSLLGEAKKLRVNVRVLIKTYRDLKSSGLSITQLSEALSYKRDLEASGYAIDNLRKIYEVSKKYGGYGEVLEAINTYGSLKALKTELKKVGSEREKLEKKVEELKGSVERLEKREAQLKGFLNLYEELKRLGFDETTLNKLKRSSEKYGGPREVLEAVNAYTSLTELQSNVRGLEKKKSDLEAELKRIQAKYAHLEHVVKVCEDLLYSYGFSVPAIETLYKVAKRYGSFFEVLEAVGKYGELKKIEAEVEKLKAEKSELKARVRELNKQIREARGVVSELNTSIKSALTSLMEGLEKSVGRLADKFSEATETLSSSFRKAQKDISETYANSIAKVVSEVSKASIVLGQLEERAKRIEGLSVIMDLIERPQSVEKPVREVMSAALALVLGLKNYVDINEDKVKDAYQLKSRIESLKEQLIKCLRG